MMIDKLEADPETVPLAHAGAAVVLFSRFNPATAEALAGVLEGQGDSYVKSGIERAPDCGNFRAGAE